jgi:hypothetical protein
MAEVYLVLRNNFLYRVSLEPLEVLYLGRSSRSNKKGDIKAYGLPFKAFAKLPDAAKALILEVAQPLELGASFCKEVRRRENSKSPEHKAAVNRAKNVLRKALEGLVQDD